MSFILGIITAMLMLDLLWWWRSDRLLRQRHRAWRALLAAFMLVQISVLLWMVLGRIFDLGDDESVPLAVMAMVFLWHFIVLPAVMVVWPVGELARLLSRRDRVETPVEPTGPAAGPSRREFIGIVATATPPVVAAVATGFSLPQLDEFRIREITVRLPTLPIALDGMRIAHVTDVHVGRFTSGRVLNQVIEATNGLRADLVLMTGDLINHAIADLPAALDMVKRLDARHGVYMCEGNHDLIESRQEFESRTRASGVPLLINEQTPLRIAGEPVQLLGLRWGSSKPGASRGENRGEQAIADSMERLLALRHPDAFSILLAHHPHAFDPAAAAGIPLTLAGHTHGGQLMLTPNLGFGPWMYKYWSGLYQQNDSALVVSNGVGNWFPLRTNAPAEIVHLTLRRM
jgi:predicted MPP superfamily phosphohydrolase